MQFELDFARRFRESAETMRAVAAGETNIKACGILDRIAEEYDRTAAELEALDREHTEQGVEFSASASPPAVRAA
jgi:hypothetical protein